MDGPLAAPREENQRRERSRSRDRSPSYYVREQPRDENLPANIQDPRGEDPTKRITKKASHRGNGRNTESFEPKDTLVRPEMRIRVHSKDKPPKKLKHDDVIIVPELFGDEEDWSLYYQLINEIKELQDQQVKQSEFISWHEGAHLIVKNPEESPTFQKIIDKLCEYFHIRKESMGYRFNWYRDSSDWKPFHHDSAAFNPKRAKTQNITVGVSFGAARELAFLRANDSKTRLAFPQTNNGVFSFGRDTNILWKHGVNALAPEDQDGKGRISIIVWGLAQNVIEEAGSPSLLGSDGQGPHAQRRHDNRGRRNNHHHDRRHNHHNDRRGGGDPRRDHHYHERRDYQEHEHDQRGHDYCRYGPRDQHYDHRR